ncbi:hypothetical protein PanWU01x14_254440 [Parasponia andersonii]|uniref:Uncharacterized protein n=1 Tax=Parasponia andersonii TaxID=3476 RepID=A0A2P5BB60_PARAD|nr:hypothetical protein PanWU01x14_254440 [Parasponia andersonii]
MSDQPPPLATTPPPSLTNALARNKELSKTKPMPPVLPHFDVRRSHSSPAKVSPPARFFSHRSASNLCF